MKVVIIFLWIPLIITWYQNKESDMFYYTVYIMDSTQTVIYSKNIQYPDTIATYTMNDSIYNIVYCYATATDTAYNQSLPSDTVHYRVETDITNEPEPPETFKIYEPYPSITGGYIHIRIKAYEYMKGSIICYNVLGQIVLNRKIEVQPGIQLKTIDINSNSGVYFIRIEFGKEVEIRRVLLIK